MNRRKILIALIILALSGLVWVYFFIPSQITLNESVWVTANKNTINRALNDSSLWKQWWPDTTADKLHYNGFSYQLQLPGLYAFAVNVSNNTTNGNTILSITEKNPDSALLIWRGVFSAGNNPFSRFLKYREINRLTNDMKDILLAAKKFLSKPQHIYGIEIKKEIVKDTLLLNTHSLFSHYPSTEEIYSLINKLHTAARRGKAPVTGYPMLNITKKDSALYLLRVALPVSKPVKEQNGIVIKRMIPGNILVSDNIQGGTGTVDIAFKQMMNYARDLDKTLPAIPFQSLITNRLEEKDSTKWLTRIYCPVI